MRLFPTPPKVGYAFPLFSLPLGLQTTSAQKIKDLMTYILTAQWCFVATTDGFLNKTDLGKLMSQEVNPTHNSG